MRPLVLLMALATASLMGSCTKVDFRTSNAGGVPATLEGEWYGTWASSQTNEGGEVVLRVQEFEDQPVVGMQLTHPCLPTSTYEIVFAANRVALRSAGRTIFEGTLVEGRTLVGTFACDMDAGTWLVTWRRALPPPVDLSGTWRGEIESSRGNTPLRLQFDQRAVQGVLEVTGLLELPNELQTPLPVRGIVQSRDDVFELQLTTVPGIVPQIVIGGLGDSASLEVEAGLVATSGQPLPFTQGVASFAQVPEER